MKIGIGISTTRSRERTFNLCLKMFRRFTPQEGEVEFIYHVQVCYPKHSGVAAVKNDCLRALMEAKSDFIFLFDDDCFPRKKEWWKLFIEAALMTQQHHLLFLAEDWQKPGLEKVGRRKMKEENGLDIFNISQGCCMFFSKECVNGVGAFDEKFTGYGFEHENYSLRCHRLGFNTIDRFMTPAGVSEYIHSLDVHGCFDDSKRFPDWDYRPQLGSDYDPTTRMLRSAMPRAKMKVHLETNAKIITEPAQLTIPLWK